MKSGDANELFIKYLTTSQTRLYAYIFTLLPDRDGANDVLQETNLVLWRKAAEFAEGMSFAGWSNRVAYFQVLAWLRERGRDRRRFADRVMDLLASEVVVDDIDYRLQALRDCITKLSEEHRRLIALRYEQGRGVKGIAQMLNKTETAISRMLYRIRLLLRDCVSRHQAAQASD